MWFEGDWLLQILVGAVLSQFVTFYLNTCVKNNDLHNIPFLKTCLSKYIFATICLLITVLVVPLIIVVVILCTLYRGLVHIILKAKYREKFKGFVAGRDVIWLVEDPKSRNIVVSLLLVEKVEEETKKSVYEIVKEALLNEVNFGSLKDTKLVHSFHQFSGYFYDIQEESLSADSIVEFDTSDPKQEYISHDEVGHKLSMYCNNPLPQNHTRYCEILVSKKPIIWKQFDSKKSYPIILRIQHSLGDGISIFNIITGCLNSAPLTVVDHKIIKDNKNGFNYNNKKPFLDGVKNLIIEYAKTIGSFLIFVIFFPNCVVVQNLLRPKDINPLHGPKLSGHKKFYWNTEDHEELIPILKRMKNRVSGSYFVDFMVTAFSASFHEYFEKKKSTKLPKYITGVVPARINFKKGPHQDCTKDLKFTNNFAVALLNLPIEIADKSTQKTSLIQRFRENIRQTHKLRDSTDPHVNYWGLTIFNAVIPAFFLHYFYQLYKFTFLLSVLPGPDSMSLFNAVPVNELLFWLPNRGYVGVGLTCLSFNKRFHLGLIVDQALFSKDDNLQEILDNIPKYLKMLENEIIGPIIT